MADFVEYTLDDGSTVLFESSDEAFGAPRTGNQPKQGGPLAARLTGVSEAAQQVAEAMRARLQPDELSLELGVKVAGEVNAWFFAKQQGEATIKVTLTWRRSGPDPEQAVDAAGAG